jgi:tight adherence protein B
MKGTPIQNALAAARAFAAHANQNEQIAVVTFNGSVKVLQSFTTSTAALDSALGRTPTLAYGTKNYDALQTSLGLLANTNVPSESVIMLTDGQNVGSVSKPNAVLHQLAKAHVRVFAVGLQSLAFKPGPLEQMADVTGGEYVAATGPAKLRPILVDLGRRLSDEYLLTYKTRQNPGKQVAVNVSVRGVPGTAATDYTTAQPELPSAKPYHPSGIDSVIQSSYTALFIAFLFASLIGYAIVTAAASRAEPLVERVGDFVSVQRATVAAPTPREKKKRRGLLARRAEGADREQPGWSERLGKTLDLADIDIEPMQFVILSTLGTVLVILILAVITPLLGLVGFLTPLLIRSIVLGRISRKRRAFAEQLPDNLDVLASALRAGHSLVSALAVVAADASEPSKSEFQRVLAEEQFGAQLEDAFRVAVERMSNPDLDQVALVSRLQREMGSNSAEVLDRVIETVRARMELRRLVRTLTAQGRLSRWVLTLLPIALAAILGLMSSGYMHPLFHRPAGQVMLVGAACMVALGSWLIGKIIEIKV